MRTGCFIAGIIFSVAVPAQTPGTDLGKTMRDLLVKENTGGSSVKFIPLLNGVILRVPEKYSRTGRGMDSEMGVLESPGLKINFDIGFSAGAHIGDHNKSQFTAYYDTTINGHKIYVGTRVNGIVKEIVFTIYAGARSQRDAFLFPANFWAFVKGEDDLREMLSIGLNYKPLE